MSINVRGLGDTKKRRELFYFLHHKDCDLMCLQETHSINTVEKLWKTEWGHKIWYSHGTSQSKGVAILAKKDFPLKVCEIIRDHEGRYIMLKGEYEREKLLVVNIYGPNIDAPVFYNQLFGKIDRFDVENKVIMGDMNTVLDYTIDRSPQKQHKNKEAALEINRALETQGLVDCWREKKKNFPGFTWRRHRPYTLAERLDYIFINEALLQFLDRIRVQSVPRTDHDAVIAVLVFRKSERGRGFWKFNTSLLKDKDYLDKINQLLDIELQQAHLYDSVKKHWEIIKLAVRGTTLQYTARKKKARQNETEILEKKISFWQNQLDHTYFPKVEERITVLKKELETLNAKKTEGAVLRCKVNWQEFAEKPTKYFLNLEKVNFNKKTIHRLRNNGKIIDNPDEIQTTLTDYFKDIYKSKKSVDLSYLEELEFPKITTEQSRLLDQEITMFEISLALKELKGGKSPGVDGLPPEFYKVFWMRLKQMFYNLIQEIVRDKKLHLSARRGIITLIEKLGKDPLELDNWRPISLLCADYKIFAKLVARRLETILPSIIHESQTGFMKNRNIAENAMKLLSLMDYAEQNKTSAIVISFDFRKAFDCIEWPAIYAALEKFGCGSPFIQIVRILYTDIFSAVMNNGKWGDWFELERSTRQGCNASALIFLCVAEILGLKIQQNVKIQGIEMMDFTLKSAQYADDIWVALVPDSRNINNLLTEMESFRKFSGLEINYTKTVAFQIGPCRNSDVKYYTIKPLCWSMEPVKILGIYFHPDWRQMHRLNFDRTIDKIKSILESWSLRQLSLIGKITLINSLIINQLTFQFAALPTPDEEFFARCKRIILEFIWEGKPHKVRYEMLKFGPDRIVILSTAMKSNKDVIFTTLFW